MSEGNIDEKVDEKIDEKISVAQLPEISQESAAINIPSKTTVEQDLRTADQRKINLIWERTQRNIAMFVVITANLVSAIVVIRGVFVGISDASLTLAAFTLLSSGCFLVSGFYFGRTNHARIGDDPNRRSTGSLDDR